MTTIVQPCVILANSCLKLLTLKIQMNWRPNVSISIDTLLSISSEPVLLPLSISWAPFSVNDFKKATVATFQVINAHHNSKCEPGLARTTLYKHTT